MRKILFSILFVTLSFYSFAGSKKLTKEVCAYWPDRTEAIEYESYAVIIKLTGPLDFNVTGSIYCGGKIVPVFINAGEVEKSVYIDGLSNGKRYDITVKLNDYSAFPKKKY